MDRNKRIILEQCNTENTKINDIVYFYVNFKIHKIEYFFKRPSKDGADCVVRVSGGNSKHARLSNFYIKVQE